MPTPCESWPLRLASTRLAATACASSRALPAAAMMSATVARSCAAECFLLIASSSHHRADLPGHEFVLPVAMPFALARLARGGGQHQAEDAFAHLLDRRLAVDDLAAVDVHVLFLPLPQRAVGGDLQRG